MATEGDDTGHDGDKPCFVCAHCGAAMIIVQTFVRGQLIRAPPHHSPAP